MKRRLFGLLFVLTLLLALPFAASASEFWPGNVPLQVTPEEKTEYTYGDKISFTVLGEKEDEKGTFDQKVTDGYVIVEWANTTSDWVQCYVSNGIAEFDTTDLPEELLDQPLTLRYRYSGSNYWIQTEQAEKRVIVKPHSLDSVALSYSGYGSGLPVSGFQVTSPADSHFTVGNCGVVTTDANFGSQTYIVQVTLTPNTGYTLANAKVTLNGAIGTFEGTSDGDTYTFQLPATCAVQFVTAHGSTPDTQIVKQGGTASEPAAPSAEGWAFKGWYRDSDCTEGMEFNFAAEIKTDTTLYAKWVKSYTVTFNGNNHGGSTIPSKMTVAEDEPVKEPTAPTEKDYLFKGWYTDEACTTPFEFNKTINKDMDLYAKWVEAPVVSFDANGHGKAPASVRTDANGKVTKPSPDPTEKGYAFKGWYTEKACLNPFDFEKTVVEKNTTLYAKWVETYTVTFDRNGHGKSPDAQTVERGEKAAEPTAPTEKGWRFDGWYTDKECTKAYNFNTNVTEDTTLYAKWTQMYTLTFNTNGGTKIESEEFAYGELVYLGDYKPTKSGYYFVGWHTTSDLKRSSRVSYVRMDSNKTVYAKFSVADKTNPKTADPAMPGLAMAVLSFSAVGLAAVGFKKRK